MTGTDLSKSWPELGNLAAELRRVDQALVADRLIAAVRAGSTSGEVFDGVGVVLRDHRTLRSRLGDAGARAWDAVMADVNRAYPGSRIGHWLARLVRRFS